MIDPGHKPPHSLQNLYADSSHRQRAQDRPRACAKFPCDLIFPMRRQIQVLGCLFAWLIATGCQWDLAQLIAWTRMFSGYSQELSLSAAARKTFSGEMCNLCKAVQKGKQEQEHNLPDSSASGKIKLLDAAPLSADVRVISPARHPIGIVPAPRGLASRDRMAPPLPPPRVAA